MKKFFLPACVFYLVILLGVPGFLVFNHYNILTTGELYKFKVQPYDPYDPFRGRYVAIRQPSFNASGSGPYALLEKDTEGFARIASRQETKPNDRVYAKNFDISRYYMNEKLAPKVETLQRKIDTETDQMYVQVAVKNGGYVIKGLYLNGTPVEELVE
ncbi:hypothetical protein AGMMS49579_22840 [Spirochaetia bacterium]|nr:hypothetical protein AGMMS49579_22840 [Spirochaetia bacterium]